MGGIRPEPERAGSAGGLASHLGADAGDGRQRRGEAGALHRRQVRLAERDGRGLAELDVVVGVRRDRQQAGERGILDRAGAGVDATQGFGRGGAQPDVGLGVPGDRQERRDQVGATASNVGQSVGD